MSDAIRGRRRALRIHLALGGDGSAAVDAVRARARELALWGWVREASGPAPDRDSPGASGIDVHAEGDPGALDQLLAFLRGGAGLGEPVSATVAGVAVEGHEQFAVRGRSTGVFVVQEHQATAHHFDLRLEVDGAMRSWAVPKGPSLDPAVKRFAVEVGDHAMAHNAFEGLSDRGAVIIWDRGPYEQGGRVPWPAALERGHAVFVLHGEKLRGGFALQRTRAGEKPQWLLIKRRDEQARPGSEITTERPASVASGRTLAQLLAGA